MGRGNERTWWQCQGLDPLAVAAALWATTHEEAVATTSHNADRKAEINAKIEGRHVAIGADTTPGLRTQNDETKPILRPKAE
jgi:hypothetical protein